MIKIDEMEIISTKKVETDKKDETVIDFLILEHIYSATMQEIMNDTDLFKLILSNGFYKSAFCEAFMIEKLVISVDGVEHILNGPPKTGKNTISIYDIVLGKELVKPAGIKIVNLD